MAFVPSHIGIIKILVLLKRILRPIFFRKTIEHALPFFVKSNCLLLSSFCSYLLYDTINRQRQLTLIINHFIKTSAVHTYITRPTSNETFSLKLPGLKR